EGENGAGGAEGGDQLGDAEERPVAAAQLLRSLEVAVRREMDPLPLQRLDDEQRDILALQPLLECFEVAERDLLELRQQGLEARRELLVAVGREGAERQPMETVLGGGHALTLRRGAPELDRGLDRLRAGAREQAAF